MSISYDESLLRARHWILETAGFNVTSAFGLAQATTHVRSGAFDLVIIGHSIPRQDKKSLLKMLRSHHHCRVLALYKAGDEPFECAAHWLEAGEGPEALVSAVRKILNIRPASGSTQRLVKLALVSNLGRANHGDYWEFHKSQQKLKLY
ncbi:MAG TPA: hypothetical protein VG759_11225 [Candidatus Angelobacter sp.]|nr:hypothetical protein [Candidatus Angelobacter sp.]